MRIAPFSFMEACALLKERQPHDKKIKIVASGTTFQLEPFLKAEAAIRGINLSIETIAFGTLRQYLLDPFLDRGSDIIMLCPWDFIGGLDWRTGLPQKNLEKSESAVEIEKVINILKECNFGAIFYLNSPLQPATGSIELLRVLQFEILAATYEIGAEIISGDAFGLDAYLASGCPISGSYLGKTAQIIARRYFDKSTEAKKIIVTDLDNTFWSGVLGEDGIDGLIAEPEGNGYLHFIYQTMLKRLKSSGVLIAIASKNNEEDVYSALSMRNFALKRDDFVAIKASYQPKSLQISELSKSLNLGMEHFVFIDDNPLELAEVGQALPAITTLLFPKETADIVPFLGLMHHLFPSNIVTDEDLTRTDMYRKMAASASIISGVGHNIGDYLRTLNMQMIIRNRSVGERVRAVQLINKTNQFNINGIRWTDNEVAECLAQGGMLYTAELSDINGNHGEVLALLIDDKNTILSYVMSCRTFQRRAEFAFLGALTLIGLDRVCINYIKTERNEPVQLFLNELFPLENAERYDLGSNELQELLRIEGSFFNIVIEGGV